MSRNPIYAIADAARARRDADAWERDMGYARPDFCDLFDAHEALWDDAVTIAAAHVPDSALGLLELPAFTAAMASDDLVAMHLAADRERRRMAEQVVMRAGIQHPVDFAMAFDLIAA